MLGIILGILFVVGFFLIFKYIDLFTAAFARFLVLLILVGAVVLMLTR